MARLKARRLNRSGDASKYLTVLIWAILALGIIFLIWAQNNLLTVYDTVYKVGDLPKSLVGYKIVHISDMNNSTVQVVGKVEKLKPDVIILSGGYKDANGKADNSIEQIKKLTEIAPVYYVYNIEDGTDDILASTGATNLTDGSIVVEPKERDVNTFIKDNYGEKILNKAKDGDKDAKKYVEYVTEALEKTKGAKIRITGLNTYDYENGKYDALKKINEMTEKGRMDYEIVIAGNAKISPEVSKANINAIFSGGSYGTNYISDTYKKGSYGMNDTQFFLSGGVGKHKGVTRIFNFPEIQCITLSDGTIEDENPLEELLGIFFKDVGTIYDNDGGFESYKYEYEATK